MENQLSQLAEIILETIKDYHNYQGFQFSSSNILEWVNQFDENDRVFILEEFSHLLNQGIYCSETKARELLIQRIKYLSAINKFSNPMEFLSHTVFLRLQNSGKSQDILLGILDQELIKIYGFGVNQCGKVSQKYIIYLDDILATGKTVLSDCLKWLPLQDASGKSNLNKILGGEIIFIVSLLCYHNNNNVLWSLKLQFNQDAILKKVLFYSDYKVENHPKFQNQQLNFAYPISNQPQNVLNYFDNLPASTKANVAFRNPILPSKETFFSTPENRIRFENILLSKGVELLSKANNLKPNHRPLGATFPSYKTLGTGTLFFTWSNVSNTCPIIFWWKAGGWKPLFPLRGRGL